RVACRFAEAAWLPAFVRAVYRANFADGLDIAAPDTISRCLGEAGAGDPAPILAEAQSPASRALLRARTEEAARRGLFGAPSFLVGDELFWGNDRLEAALAWAAGPGAEA